MRSGLVKLFLVELRRLWPVASFFIPLGLTFLSTIILLLSARQSPVYDFARWATQSNSSLVVPFASALFCTGIISTDVKEGWLRTLLIRPVTREQYLLVRILAAFASVTITVIVAGVLPNAVIAFFAKGTVHFDFGTVLAAHGIFLLQAMFLIALFTLFSCWLPGVFNVVVVAVWYIVSGMLGSYIQMMHWSSKWYMMLKDFMFPSGFTNSLDMVLTKMGTPVAQLAWGFGSLGVVLALAFWSIARIQVDKSSE